MRRAGSAGRTVLVSHRISIRGIAAATAVVAVSTVPTLGATALADREVSATAPVADSRPLPASEEARSPRPSPAFLAEVAAKQERETARKRAARKAREARAARAEERASRSSARTPVSSGSARGIAASMAIQKYGWGAGQFGCLEALWDRESGWNHTAANPSSGAYGIPQALPGSKMAAFGADWRTNPATQIAWGLDYVDGRYGTPCAAWSAFQSKGWY
jgi:hypothetical protein